MANFSCDFGFFLDSLVLNTVFIVNYRVKSCFTILVKHVLDKNWSVNVFFNALNDLAEEIFFAIFAENVSRKLIKILNFGPYFFRKIEKNFSLENQSQH